MALSSSIMVSLVWMGKRLTRSQMQSITAFRKARLKMPSEGDEDKPIARGSSLAGLAPTATATSTIGNVQSSPEEDGSAASRNVRPIVFTAESKDLTGGRLTDAARRPFEMDNTAIKTAYKEFVQLAKNESSSNTSSGDMEAYLWDRFWVRALPKVDAEGRRIEPFERFQKSILRHVSLFYGEYVLLGGREPRRLGILACGEVGLEGGGGEYEREGLSELAGSQGALMARKIAYAKDPEKFPFTLDGQGNVQLVSKYYEIEKHPHKDGRSESTERATSERRLAAETRTFSRELNALSTVKGIAGVIQAVCYERRPEMRIVYPLMRAGDLVPLETDHLAYYDPAAGTTDRRPLTPDETFLPRFFRQLVLAVYEMHQRGLLHLDIKPENLVVYGPDRNFILPAGHPALRAYQLVLLDMGLSRRLEDLKDGQCVDRGTDVVMAPEQLMCNYGTGRATDVRQLGAAIWRTRVFWEPSLSEKQRDEILHSRDPQWGHYRTDRQSFFSDDFWDVLSLLLTADPAERDYTRDQASIDKLLSHPYLLKGRD